jgi:hypothetical protein
MKRKVMRPILRLIPLLVAALNRVDAQEVSGDWQGTLPGGSLPLRPRKSRWRRSQAGDCRGKSEPDGL